MPSTSRRKPQRTCIGCRKKDEPVAFLRVFREPGGRVLIYEGGAPTGRSAYMCANAACIEAALTKERLARALHGPVSIEERDALRDALICRLR